MKYLLIFAFFTLSFQVEAYWGTGVSNGNYCPYDFAQASRAANARDEKENLIEVLNSQKRKLAQKRRELLEVETRLGRAREAMRPVLRTEALSAVERHARGRYGRTNYRNRCRGGGDEDGMPVPDEFCVQITIGKFQNRWHEYVRDDGRFDDGLCNNFFPARDSAPERPMSERCRAGLHDLHLGMRLRRELEIDIRRLEASIRTHFGDLERLEDDIAEGGYCPDCDRRRRGYSSVGGPDFINLGNTFGLAQPLPTQPPPAIPLGAHLRQPYTAQVPGYMGMHNGVYGGLPGAVGPGAFGCAGTNPGALGQNFFSSPFDSFFQTPGTQNLFGNPFSPPLLNPNYSNGLFQSGFGPNFLPTLNGRPPVIAGPATASPNYWNNPNPWSANAPGGPRVLPYYPNPNANSMLGVTPWPVNNNYSLILQQFQRNVSYAQGGPPPIIRLQSAAPPH